VETHQFDYRISSTIVDKIATIGDLQDHLRKMYQGSVGVEFEHIHSENERLWLYENYEEAILEEITPSEKIKIL